MKPRELFEVAVRIVGLIGVLVCVPDAGIQTFYAIHGAPQIGIDAPVFSAARLLSPLIALLLALFFLFGGRLIARAVYGSEKSS